jgi:hypothetical protein
MTSSITLGPDGIRFQAGELSRTAPRAQVVELVRAGTGAMLYIRAITGDDPAKPELGILRVDLPSATDADAVEAWILAGSPGQLVPASAAEAVEGKPDPKTEIGPGSLVQYNGRVHVVSRENHDGEVRRWRLEGYPPGRGANARALRPASPIRPGDMVEVSIKGQESRSGRVLGHDWLGEALRFFVGFGPGDARFVTENYIWRVTRDLGDGEVAVIR